ncbi:MAG: GDP-mannose 4,6-dehydratase, partial [Schwartzia sp.]|nr:GDP-mannose 4,6-dehydratase [Schwartzia sp. (in: firmicutes)]
GSLYNVGGHNEKRNIDVVKIILKALDKPESLIRHVEDRKGHDLRYAIDPAKLKAELGWEPKTLFEDGIRRTIDWYLANKDWWEHVTSGEYGEYYKKHYGAAVK